MKNRTLFLLFIFTVLISCAREDRFLLITEPERSTLQKVSEIKLTERELIDIHARLYALVRQHLFTHTPDLAFGSIDGTVVATSWNSVRGYSSLSDVQASAMKNGFLSFLTRQLELGPLIERRTQILLDINENGKVDEEDVRKIGQGLEDLRSIAFSQERLYQAVRLLEGRF